MASSGSERGRDLLAVALALTVLGCADSQSPARGNVARALDGN